MMNNIPGIENAIKALDECLETTEKRMDSLKEIDRELEDMLHQLDEIERKRKWINQP